MAKKKEVVEWKVNTPQLLKEIVRNNHGMSVLRVPLQIFANTLSEVADRAIQLNDPKLNHLMCRLALYGECDPYTKDFNKKIVEEVKRKAETSNT